MAWAEKPPILTGREKEDISAIRDYLFRMAQSLNEVVNADSTTETGISISHNADGTQVLRPGGGGDASNADIEKVRKNAQELRSLILKSAKDLQKQIDEIENNTFYIKYADDFAGDYPVTMYNTPTENTYYMGVCSTTAQTAPTDPSVYTWSRIKGNGGTGLNSATIFLYRRANSAPPKPKADLTYTFASGRLDLGPASVSGHKLLDADVTVTGSHVASLNTAEVENHLASVTGWTQEIPDTDGRPCWVITATAIATTATDVIAASEWSEVKKLVEDGERGREGLPGRDGTDGSPGRDGTDGTDGTDGVDGYNNIIVFLYKRSATAPTIDFTADVGYTFSTKTLSPIPSGWSRTPPETGTDPLYVTAATAMSRTDTDSIAYTEWSSPTMVAENGEQGTPGTPGTDGRTPYLHIKYSNDGGETFTDNYGEELGTWIGMYNDYTETDSRNVEDYAWKRFSDDSELLSIIDQGNQEIIEYVDSKEETYNQMYLARSEFGTFQENVTSMIETTAKGVVESYDYGSSIQSVQDSIGMLQSYYTSIQGEIRRGIVEDPDNPGEYVTGIAIAQALKFSGECGPTDPRNPGDGYTYYYMNSGQTFGLYTSVGWQFWIDGYKKGWYNSQDGMLHVANVLVESILQIGAHWQVKSNGDGTELEFLYVG
ncbi:MAG: hypothetical protein IJV40_03540 [Oscillospiraceae bacterium]|nr:hypothetical protein [Oscillospiraceae bacterium]